MAEMIREAESRRRPISLDALPVLQARAGA
jgi:hypothetical protein